MPMRNPESPATVIPSGPAGGELDGNFPNPSVQGLKGDALPSTIVHGFLKRNAADDAWEFVAYGSGANTVTEGDDARLSDSRDPNAHAASHQDGGSDEVATATPAPNAIPKADGAGLLDAWVSAILPGLVVDVTDPQNGDMPLYWQGTWLNLPLTTNAVVIDTDDCTILTDEAGNPLLVPLC